MWDSFTSSLSISILSLRMGRESVKEGVCVHRYYLLTYVYLDLDPTWISHYNFLFRRLSPCSLRTMHSVYIEEWEKNSVVLESMCM